MTGERAAATTTSDADSRPRLARGVRVRLDHVTGAHLLLRPEQGFELRGSALEIVKLCAGDLTVDGIVDRLVEAHNDTPRDQIAADVHRLLVDLAGRGLIEMRQP
jgi:pyrroloquinoline quinone biosynthesis protein D